MGVPAIVAAGDGRASRAVHGENKAYLELGGRPLVARVVAALQRVPEVSEVWVVGRPERLEPILGAPAFREELRKPLVVVPQFRNLMENAWETFRRLLPGAGPEGRDPTPEEEDLRVLYLSSDLPFATPQEISAFIRRSLALPDCDYALGLVTEPAMEPFYPHGPGEPGIQMAYFNLNEGRFRQSNLHLVRPARLGHREHIQNMYEHRYQKQLGNALALAWKIVTSEGGGAWMLWYYLLMHLAGVADRHRLRRLADRLRRPVTLPRVERACGRLLRTRFRFVCTEVGGCAVDIDNEEDFDTAAALFERWWAQQARRAEELHGPLPLPARAGDGPALRVLEAGEDDVSEEARARAVRESAGCFRLGGRGTIEVTGSERVRWLDGMVSGDVKALDARGAGAGCYALLLTPQGRILADLHVLLAADAIWLELERDALPAAMERLDRFIIADDVTLRSLCDEQARLAVEGPRARALLERAAGGAALPAESEGFRDVEIAGAPVRVAAYGFTGEEGFQLFAPASAEASVHEALLRAGDPMGAVEGDAALLELLRVEAGTPWLGRELDETVLPAEARLERAVSTTKGCYTGQEVVARLRTRGRVNHLLVGLRPASGDAPAAGTELRADGRRVGEVTSAVRSPRFGPIALGFVRAECAEPGTGLAWEAGRVRVEALPFGSEGVAER